MTKETSRVKQPEAIFSYEEGPKFKKFGGKTVAAATIGDYLVNLDLWAIYL